MSESTGNGRLTAFLTLRGGWGGLAAALLYAALLALLFPEGVFHGQVFVSPDSVAPQGFADYVAREGIAPGDALWNPFIFGGMPAYASLAHDRNLYPPGPLLRGLSAIHLLPPLGWLLAHYLWLGLGVFLFLRRRGVRPYLAWLAGAWFVLLPPQVAIGAHGHGSKVMTLAWLPWALLFVDRLLDRRRALMDAGLFGLSLAGLLLAGHIQVAYYALLTLGLFALGRLVLIARREGPARALAPLALGLAALALAGAASLPLYGPVKEYSAHSIRGAAEAGASYDYATGWSLAPAEWSTFLWPASWGFGAESYFGRMPLTDYGNALGILPLLAAVPLFWRRRPRAFDVFFLALALAATLVAAGRFLPAVYRPLYEHLPGFGRFRVPVMILLLQQLAVATLMARGLELALRESTALSRLRLLLAAGAAAMLISAAVLPGKVEDRARQALAARYSSQLARVSPQQARDFVDGLAALPAGWVRDDALRAGLLLLPVLAALELRRRRGVRGAMASSWERTDLLLAGALLLAVLGDLLPQDGRVLHPAAHWPTRRGVELWGEREPAAERLPARTLDYLERNLDHQRFYALPGSPFAANGAAAAGLASLGGYHAAKLALADSVLKALPTAGPELLDRFAVSTLIAPRGTQLGAGFPPAPGAEGCEEAVFVNPGALGRLRLADRAAVEPPAASRQRLFAGRAEPGLVYVDAPPDPAPAPGDGPPGAVERVEWALDTVDCSVRLDRPALLVLADMAYPGWRVSVDGAERPLLTADGLLRAVGLAAGEHAVRFEFAPPRLAAFRWLGRAAWALLLLLSAAGGLLARPRRQEREGTA